MDPHVLKHEDSSPNFIIDNPLSQNPSKLLFPLFIAYLISSTSTAIWMSSSAKHIHCL